MLASKEKISIRQAMFIFFVMTYTAALKYIPGFSAINAKQAAWITPIYSTAVVIPVLLILSSIYKKHQEKSFTEIIELVFGKILGKLITVIYILLITIISIVTIKNSGEKFVSTIYPNHSNLIFILVMLITVAFILRNGGIVVIARMNDIIFPVILIIFISLSFISLRDIKISRLTPISYLDILPSMKAGIAALTIKTHLPFIFLFSNYINDKEKIKKVCIQAALLEGLLVMMVLIITVGVLGASTVELSPVPFITAIKQISLFGIIERMEAFAVSLWIFSDFALIAVLVFTILNMLSSLFRLKNTKGLIGILLVVLLFLALIFESNAFENKVLGTSIVWPLSIFLGYIMPVMVFITGKIRKLI